MTDASKPRRHRIVAVRMSDAEHADACACAAALGISLARLMRSRAAAIPPSRTDLATARELTRIGNNLNQLVRQVHGGFRPHLEPVLLELREQIAELAITLGGCP